jgi:hypothetical protein
VAVLNRQVLLPDDDSNKNEDKNKSKDAKDLTVILSSP